MRYTLSNRHEKGKRWLSHNALLQSRLSIIMASGDCLIGVLTPFRFGCGFAFILKEEERKDAKAM